ncbi:hypothetical protein Vretimale_6278 [Volvox reticuliferus]|nr:hypothetical protein Vretimale_6278 [Volvox reticuliferus]
MAAPDASSLSPYRIEVVDDPIFTIEPNLKMCFKIHVSRTVPSCRKDHYCCFEAAVNALQVDVNPACYHRGTRPSAYVRQGSLDRKDVRAVMKRVPADTFSGYGAVVRVTNLGISSERDVSDYVICITPGLNKDGLGCNSLRDLCTGDIESTPSGDHNGVDYNSSRSCAVALFYKHGFCCTSGKARFEALRPPPPPDPPSPPRSPNSQLDLPPGPGCSVCIQISLDGDTLTVFQPLDCEVLITTINELLGTLLLEPVSNSTLTCTDLTIAVCGNFRGYLTPPDLENILPMIHYTLLQKGTMTGCGGGTQMIVEAFLINNNDYGSCQAWGNMEPYVYRCIVINVNFPRCQCSTSSNPTPFIVKALFYRLTTSRNPNTDLYCFDILTVKSGGGPCFSSPAAQVLSQISFYAKEAMRGKLVSIGVLPPGVAVSKMAYYTPSWDAGQGTVKVMNLNWTTIQANGARVCLELDKTINPYNFCEYEDGPSSYCWVALHDKNNCPRIPPASGQICCCPRFQVMFTPSAVTLP